MSGFHELGHLYCKIIKVLVFLKVHVNDLKAWSGFTPGNYAWHSYKHEVQLLCRLWVVMSEHCTWYWLVWWARWWRNTLVAVLYMLKNDRYDRFLIWSMYNVFWYSPMCRACSMARLRPCQWRCGPKEKSRMSNFLCISCANVRVDSICFCQLSKGRQKWDLLHYLSEGGVLGEECRILRSNVLVDWASSYKMFCVLDLSFA